MTEHGDQPQVRTNNMGVPSRPQSPQRAPSPLPSTSKAADVVQPPGPPVTSSQPLPSIQPLVSSPQPSTSRDDTAARSQLLLPEAEIQLPEAQQVTNTSTDASLNPDILDILGIDPTTVVDHGLPINAELANRLTYIVTSGLKKEERKDISNKYLVPENCQAITAPQLNPEIKAALSEGLLKRDKALESRQKGVATVISCLSRVLTTQINSIEPDHEMLIQLFDATRLLCDIQYNDSTSRKVFALSTLKKELKEQLANTKIGKQLFGESLGETIKTAKAVSKSGAELKEPIKKSNTSTTKNLNWKSTGGMRRPAAVPSSTRRQLPAAPSTATNTFQHHRQPPPPPPNSSNMSSHRSRPHRRR